MKKIILYLILIGSAYIAGLIFVLENLPPELIKYKLPLLCAVTGGLGGIIYCLRAVYLNVCVRKNWDETWSVWYFIRPLVSAGCGIVSYIFLKAGLLVLESDVNPDASEFGFYALAFVAGYNVDKFLKKIEGVSDAVWGIEQSRSQNINDRENDR